MDEFLAKVVAAEAVLADADAAIWAAVHERRIPTHAELDAYEAALQSLADAKHAASAQGMVIR